MMVRYENGAVTPADTPAVQAAKAQHFAAYSQAYSYLGHLGAFARKPLAFNGIKAPAAAPAYAPFSGYGLNGLYGFNGGFNPYFNYANRFMRYKRDADAQVVDGKYPAYGAYGAYPYGTYGALPYGNFGAYGAYTPYGAYGAWPYNAYGAYGSYGAYYGGAHGLYGAPRLYKKREAEAQVALPYGTYGAYNGYTSPYAAYSTPFAYGANIYNRFYNRYNFYNGLHGRGYYPYAY